MLPYGNQMSPIQNVDFSDLLPSTYPNTPRNQMVKFNNSWLFVEEKGEEFIYLVAYRAMLFKCVHTEKGYDFGGSKPAYPGDAGTPWGHGWGTEPCEEAPVEGYVPGKRSQRYFDGIGISRISLPKGDGGDPGYGLKVLQDQIIENSDGYEDPRLFWEGSKIMLHVHRFHPDGVRAARNPESYHEDGPKYQKNWGPKKNDRRLCVKCVELLEEKEKFKLGDEFFYGLNEANSIEKNFGFFTSGNRLNAVYGVSEKQRSLSVLRETERVGPYIAVARTQSDMKQDDCFARLEDYAEPLLPAPNTLVFSSGSPLIRSGEKRLLGIGHVKIRHSWPKYIMQLALKCLEKASENKSSEGISADQLLSWVKEKSSIVDSVLEERSRNTAVEAKIADFKTNGFFNSSIAPIFADLVCQSKCVEVCELGKICRPRTLVKDTVFLHTSRFYLSFFYEISENENTYSLTRFSGSFLLTDLEDAFTGGCFLQFATGLTTAGEDYLISYGENDHRSCVSKISGQKVNALLKHDAANFSPENYRFYIENARKIQLPLNA